MRTHLEHCRSRGLATSPMPRGHLRSRQLLFNLHILIPSPCCKTSPFLLEHLTYWLTTVITQVCITTGSKEVQRICNQPDLSSSPALPNICHLTLNSYLVFMSFNFLTYKIGLIINNQLLIVGVKLYRACHSSSP